MIKIIIIGASIAMFLASVAQARDVNVNGHYRSNGTYVDSYHRTSPNQYRHDNYGTSGNVNPYTSERGTNTYGGRCSASNFSC